jgi:hypothetical protein
MMTRPKNRLQLMERLDAVQLNNVWSWCAVNEAEKKAYFSIWTDNAHAHNGEKGYLIQRPTGDEDGEEATRSAARNDRNAKFALVFEQGYDAYGYFIVAKDRFAQPREMAETRTSFVMKLRIERLDDGSIWAVAIDRLEIQ